VRRLRAGLSGFRVLVGARDFSLLQSIQTGSKFYLASYWVNIGVTSQGLKWLGREFNYSSLCIAAVKKEWTYTSAPSLYRHDMGRETFLLCWNLRLYNMGFQRDSEIWGFHNGDCEDFSGMWHVYSGRSVPTFRRNLLFIINVDLSWRWRYKAKWHSDCHSSILVVPSSKHFPGIDCSVFLGFTKSFRKNAGSIP
jgi:hypothetical protein